ncbi:Flp family type IVb pilin [Massilia cavernae]|uniref:Flp family type IVb pilin n=1 Tax=Massilia cavernae TaxID=2320864 RepID=A0A418XUL0_9BURK|nr:Flp family type IVb pilin [Massilia cavernae]
MTTAVKQFVNDEDGVTAIEYGLIAALIATALLIGVDVLGDGLTNAFTQISGKLVVPG